MRLLWGYMRGNVFVDGSFTHSENGTNNLFDSHDFLTEWYSTQFTILRVIINLHGLFCASADVTACVKRKGMHWHHWVDGSGSTWRYLWQYEHAWYVIPNFESQELWSRHFFAVSYSLFSAADYINKDISHNFIEQVTNWKISFSQTDHRIEEYFHTCSLWIKDW